MAAVNGSESGTGISLGRRVAIGCFTAWLGFFSGAMVFALIARIVAYTRHTRGCEGVPSCDWYVYALVGGGLGFVTLPALVLWVLGKPAKDGISDRGM